ncbi:uncharacterized protein LOC128740170 [Sabethes cyaneus]|uniref:uncharacterized protein LOC128740170 n=1 Tax=Sabethes cyaneus TaxID=53552 RepID=UPI00237E1AFE|nr:uncharacterized protein LOC128740170 [Sabethes cyaneus]
MLTGDDTEHNLEVDLDDSTGFDCAFCDKPNHADKQMVCCEKCHKWYHFKCANVTDTVKDISWNCAACTSGSDAPRTIDLNDNVFDSKPSKGTGVSKKLADFQKEQEEAELQHKMELEQMREMQRKQNMLQLKREMEKREMQLQLEHEMFLLRKKAEAEFCAKREMLYKQFEEWKLEREDTGLGQEGASAEGEKALATKGQSSFNDPTKFGEQSRTLSTTPSEAMHQGQVKNHLQSPIVPDTHDDENAVPRRYSVLKKPPAPLPIPSPPTPQPARELTKEQIAARKGPFAKLPIFTGKPEEWPIFFSSFNNGNAACNWSNLDNLGRLQESIKGRALDLVRSRLLLPELVPTVIEELREHFGRPEQLLHALLLRARKADPPCIEQLSSFIDYGTIVKQLCDHLVAADLLDHLVNPMLINELAEKLPSATKLEWVRYKRKQSDVSLCTFSDFISEIVSEATEATLLTSLAEGHQNRSRNNKKRTNDQGFLNAHVGVECSANAVNNQLQNNAVSHIKPCRGCGRIDHRTRYCDDFKKLNYNDRTAIVKKWKLCHMCLNEHGETRCRFKGHCSIGGCNERHHALLHLPATQKRVPQSSTTPFSLNCNVHDSEQQPVIFRVVPIRIYNGNRFLDVVAFLDEGSSYSLMDSSVAKKLKLSGAWKPILIKWTAGMSRLESESRCIDLSISAKGSEEKFLLRNVHTVQQLQLPEQKVRFAEVTTRFKHLHDLPVECDQDGPPKILIGLKHLHVYAPLESRVGEPGEPIAVRTKLGWTIYGPQNCDEGQVGFAGTHSVFTDQDLHELLRSHYTMENAGVSVTTLPESAADRRARDLLEKTTMRIGDRFQTGLLWKNDKPQLPDSLPMALKRMKALERKLSKNPELEQNVERQIEEYQRKGYAHVASPQELAESEPGKVWFLPLNVVLNHRKPGKARLVWDAAAAVQGRSLNSELLKGPDFLTSLPVVMCTFRERPIGFTGDIMEMYHQIQIQPSDRSAQRFLYRPKSSDQPLIFIMDVATFGSSCSPCSAQYIKNRNAQEFVDQFPDAVQAIVNKHYVDDYLDSTVTVSEAIKRASEVAYIHSRAGFFIRNWASNSTEFLQHFSEQQNKQQLVHFNPEKENGTERVLGVSWDTTEDVLRFGVKLRPDLEEFLEREQRPTKRILLSIVMSFFDPLGLWALFTVFGKIIIQDLWRKGNTWDMPIDDESAQQWLKWIELLPKVQSMKIPRYYFHSATSSELENLQLHIFADASENAYGCVAYFRAVVNGQPNCTLVTAKSKVAPLQYTSIPRMELQAAVLAARLSVSVKSNHTLSIKQLIIWVDSNTVLSWICSDHRKYKQYVAHRIGEILSVTSTTDWRWVPTRNNIADVLTKWGTKGPPLESNGEWVNGPAFLYRPEEEWPQRAPVKADVEEELRAHFLFHEITLFDSVVDFSRFSRWTKLKIEKISPRNCAGYKCAKKVNESNISFHQ